MLSFEQEVVPGLLTVIRGGVDRQLASDLHEECTELIANGLDMDAALVTTAPDSPSPVYTRTFRGARALQRTPAIREVIELIGGTSTDSFAINEQGPLGKQKFHYDLGKVDPVRLVHASDGGGFEYALKDPVGAQDPLETEVIELNAGDIMLLHNPHLLHRGFNLSGEYRTNFAKYRSNV